MIQWLRTRAALIADLREARRELKATRRRHANELESLNQQLVAALDTVDRLSWDERQKIAESKEHIRNPSFGISSK